MVEVDATKRFHIRKINGRLGIYDRTTGALAYGPPRFLVIRSREGLKVLADRFEAAGGPGACIGEITRFEAKRSPRARIADGRPGQTPVDAAAAVGHGGPRWPTL